MQKWGLIKHAHRDWQERMERNKGKKGKNEG